MNNFNHFDCKIGQKTWPLGLVMTNSPCNPNSLGTSHSEANIKNAKIYFNFRITRPPRPIMWGRRPTSEYICGAVRVGSLSNSSMFILPFSSDEVFTHSSKQSSRYWSSYEKENLGEVDVAACDSTRSSFVSWTRDARVGQVKRDPQPSLIRTSPLAPPTQPTRPPELRFISLSTSLCSREALSPPALLEVWIQPPWILFVERFPVSPIRFPAILRAVSTTVLLLLDKKENGGYSCSRADISWRKPLSLGKTDVYSQRYGLGTECTWGLFLLLSKLITCALVQLDVFLQFQGM